MKIGVVVPINGEDQSAPSYSDMRAQALAAELAGLDSIWLYDHLIFRFPDKEPQAIHECWTVLSALAEATSRVELGTLVLCTAFRNPAVLAKMAVTLDEMSNHRVILGLGAGWHQPEFDAFGLPFDHLAARFEEAVKVIVPLVKEGAVDFSGTYVSAPNCVMLPLSTRPGGMPILIASRRPKMLRLTAEYADSWNTAWFGEVSAIGERRASMEEACRAVGRDPKTLEVTVGVSVGFPELGATVEGEPDSQKQIFGSVDDVARAFRDYASAGVGHLMVSLEPTTEESIGWLAEAAKKSRSGIDG